MIIPKNDFVLAAPVQEEFCTQPHASIRALLQVFVAHRHIKYRNMGRLVCFWSPIEQVDHRVCGQRKLP